MLPLSVVIIARNEADTIAAAIVSAKQISNDIIVIDSGSTDRTTEVAAKEGARVIQLVWEGFGRTRNIAADHATHDLIFALDADERISHSLATSVNALQPDAACVYGCKRTNYLYGRPIHHGEWGRDVVYRLYNKRHVKWTEVPVHETLGVAENNKKKIGGDLLHLTMKDREAFSRKMDRYATLMAERYLSKGKTVNVLKRFASPLFNFVQNYVVRAGFLDGKAGWEIAILNAKYTYLKYKRLQELRSAQQDR